MTRRSLASAYGIGGVPSYVFLDKEGRVARTSAGARGVELIATVVERVERGVKPGLCYNRPPFLPLQENPTCATTNL